MKIKKIKKLNINSKEFTVRWDYRGGGYFSMGERVIGLDSSIGDDILLEIIAHELMEIVLVEMHVRLDRPDVMEDYIFVYDHRQFATAMSMFTGLFKQFIK